MAEEDVDVVKILAPKGWTAKQVEQNLRLDPYQGWVSKYPIPLVHPRTRKTAPLKEFAEEILGDSRLAIETDDALVFVSRVVNSALGAMFIPVATMSKHVLRKKEKEGKTTIIY